MRQLPLKLPGHKNAGLRRPASKEDLVLLVDSAPSSDDSHAVLDCVPRHPGRMEPKPFGAFPFHFPSTAPAASEKILIKHATSISKTSIQYHSAALLSTDRTPLGLLFTRHPKSHADANIRAVSGRRRLLPRVTDELIIVLIGLAAVIVISRRLRGLRCRRRLRRCRRDRRCGRCRRRRRCRLRCRRRRRCCRRCRRCRCGRLRRRCCLPRHRRCRRRCRLRRQREVIRRNLRCRLR